MRYLKCRLNPSPSVSLPPPSLQPRWRGWATLAFTPNVRSNGTSLRSPRREIVETGVGTGSGISNGIGIRVGGGSESPTPLPPANPSDFPNLKQYYAYLVIQRFKNTITCDPSDVTKSWVGYRPCTYRGFFCEAPPDSPGTPTIASVDFNGFQLCAPTIAGFVDQLPDLALFHANSNNFTGTIPGMSPLSRPATPPWLQTGWGKDDWMGE